MIKSIIFDLDGTLLDTIRDIQSVLNESLEQFGVLPVSLEETRCYVGDGANLLVERALKGRTHLSEDVFSCFTEKFAKCENLLTVLFDGEEQALNAFKSANISLSIVTNKPQYATDSVYKTHLAKFGFDYVIGQSGKFALKPEPQSTLHIINELNLKKEECVFVGDGETDVLTAKNAGIDCIACLWGNRTKEQLASAGATRFVSAYSELVQMILG